MHLKGLIAAVVTPFDINGNINPTIISEYTKFLKAQGVAGVLVNGTTGEGFSLTNDERKTMASAWAAEKTNNFKIIIHIGHTSQKSSIKLAEHADTLKVNGIAEIGPIFFKPTKVSELVSYCINTAASTSLPYYYYHIPSMNGLDFNMFEFLGKADKKIKNLTGHFKKNKNDKHSTTGLVKAVNQRKRLLLYLKRRNPESYTKILSRLNLRK